MLVTEPTLRNEKNTQKKTGFLKNLRVKFQPIFVVIVGRVMKNLFWGTADITSTTNLFSEWKIQNSKVTSHFVLC